MLFFLLSPFTIENTFERESFVSKTAPNLVAVWRGKKVNFSVRVKKAKTQKEKCCKKSYAKWKDRKKSDHNSKIEEKIIPKLVLFFLFFFDFKSDEN